MTLTKYKLAETLIKHSQTVFGMKAIVIKNEPNADNVKVLKIKPELELDFKPGQFIMVNYETIKDNSLVNVKRAYSISSSPLNKNYIELIFDKKPYGLVSNYLYNLKENDVIEITTPNGFFIFDDHIKEDLVLIGAGTGIAPFLSIARYIKDKKLKNKIALIYSCKTNQDIILYEELKKIKHESKDFEYYITLTQDNDWDGLKGRINQEMLNSLIKDLNNKIFYLCGPPLMVLDISKVLQSLGVNKEKIKIECYE